MKIMTMIKNDPLVKAITGKSTTTRKRKPKLSAAMKRKVSAQVKRAKTRGFKEGLRARKRRY